MLQFVFCYSACSVNPIPRDDELIFGVGHQGGGGGGGGGSGNSSSQGPVVLIRKPQARELILTACMYMYVKGIIMFIVFVK